MTPLLPGELRYSLDGKVHALAIGAGFAEVDQESISVLTDMAVTADEADTAKAEQEKAAAEAALEGLKPHEDE